MSDEYFQPHETNPGLLLTCATTVVREAGFLICNHRSSPNGAAIEERLGFMTAAGKDGQRMAMIQQVTRHRAAHHAGTDPTDVVWG